MFRHVAIVFLSCEFLVSAAPIPNSKDDTFSGGLQGLEIAPKVLTNVAYGNSRLSVWGHLDNPNRTPDKMEYFVMPVVMLLPNTATCQSNVFTGDTTLRFKLVMWNEDVVSAVLVHLRKATSNPQLQSMQITTLPMEQLRLVWANSAEQLSNNFLFNTEWKSYANQENILKFEMVVSSDELCLKAVHQLKAQPDSLGSLQLQYILHATRASRRQVTVTGQHLLQGKMSAKMRNKVDSNGNVYLNSDDLNKFSQEAISNVVANSMTDADYIDTGDSISLSKLIYDSLSSFKQATTTMTPEMWKSTFWQDEFARPDKLTSYLNKVIKKDQGETHTVHVDEKAMDNEGGGSAGFSVAGLFGISASGSSKHATKTHVSEDDLRAWLKEHDYDVEWTGEVFKVKSMDLYRLNTQQLAQKQNIATTYVQVHQVQYTYDVQVAFPGDSSNVGGNVSTAAINKRLDQLENKEDDFTDKMDSLTAKINPLQLLRNNTLCQRFGQYADYTHTCPVNREIGYCVCFLFSGDKYPVWKPIITNNGRTCKCNYSDQHVYGICCLRVN